MHVTPIWVSSSLVIQLIKNCVAFKSVKPILNDVSLIFVEQLSVMVQIGNRASNTISRSEPGVGASHISISNYYEKLEMKLSVNHVCTLESRR